MKEVSKKVKAKHLVFDDTENADRTYNYIWYEDNTVLIEFEYSSNRPWAWDDEDYKTESWTTFEELNDSIKKALMAKIK